MKRRIFGDIDNLIKAEHPDRVEEILRLFEGSAMADQGAGHQTDGVFIVLDVFKRTSLGENSAVVAGHDAAAAVDASLLIYNHPVIVH